MICTRPESRRNCQQFAHTLHERAQKLREGNEQVSRWQAGYALPLLDFLLQLVGWTITIAVAAVFTLFCFVSSIVLWLRGVVSVGEWLLWSWKCKKVSPGVQPRGLPNTFNVSLWNRGLEIIEMRSLDDGGGGRCTRLKPTAKR